ncbi:PDGLE domain-containing protein [Moorellaceae bacterium AZ2]
MTLTDRRPRKANVMILLLAALAVAALLSPWASSSPDGLERVAEDLGFMHLAEGKALLDGWMPDYVFPGLQHEGLATAAAGVTGTLLTLGATWGLCKLVTMLRR